MQCDSLMQRFRVEDVAGLDEMATRFCLLHGYLDLRDDPKRCPRLGVHYILDLGQAYKRTCSNIFV